MMEPGIILRWFFPLPRKDWKMQSHVDGTIQNVTSTANPVISTGDDYDVIIGSDLLGNNFDGTIDEIRFTKGT